MLGEIIPPSDWFLLSPPDMTSRILEANNNGTVVLEKKLQQWWLDFSQPKFSLEELFFIRSRAFFATTIFGEVFDNLSEDAYLTISASTEEHAIYWLLTTPWVSFADHAIQLTVDDLQDRYHYRMKHKSWKRVKKPPYW